ncbi:E3 ubiquitin-protein ligase RGLG2 [Capsicum annuum]|nr:E3 ubiquitin-protein ligase RGLG2 [Capsicum annuum]
MGNIFSSTFVKKSVPKGLNDNSSSSSSSTSRRKRSLSRSISSNNSFEKKVLSNSKKELSKMMENKKRGKYYYIPDNFKSLDQVTLALRESGLESSNLIIGIDFTKSNEWTGKVSFNNRSLHAIGELVNPYEKAISIIGKTLSPFDEDNLIPCFGFGDGPTSYGPVIDAAVDIVERTGGQYHVLVIIADGQVTRSVNTSDSELSPQEDNTIKSIVTASMYPLSIVLVGVGDGPWEDMQKFDDRIPAREIDNFQFVNFTAIVNKHSTDSEKEAAFALAALMEIPIQYKAARELGLLGKRTGKAKKIVPKPPPISYRRPMRIPTQDQSSSLSGSAQNEHSQVCPVCLTGTKDMAFGCGHMTCRECAPRLSDCPICRRRITSRIRLYT